MGKTAERRQMTVMFVDMVGSTQRLHNCDPEEFFEFITEYQSEIKKCIVKYGGYEARIIGDGVLVYFGWPVAQEDGATYAIHSARDIVANIQQIRDPHGDVTACRIGIATGVVVVGEIVTQSGQIQDEIFGEVPHLAERLQSTGEPNSIMVCQQTHKLASDQIDFENLSQHKLKGIGQLQTIFSVKESSVADTDYRRRKAKTQLGIFGRDKELEFLKALHTKSKNGVGQIVWIGGDAGIGKSHLAESARKQLGFSSSQTVRYQFSKFHSQNPYYPFIKRTEIWAGIKPGDSAQTRLQKFQQGMNVPPSDDLLKNISTIMGFPKTKAEFSNRSETEEREIICQSLAEMLKLAIDDQNVIVLIEDVHWSDPSSSDLVKYLDEIAFSLNALILVTYRSEIEAPATRFPHSHRVSLGPLSNANTLRMVENVAKNQLPSSKILNSIVAKTDGIPLFADAYTRAFLDANSATVGDISFQGKIDVPFSLHDILMERLDRLGKPKAIAQICSAIGHEFDSELVQLISGRTDEEINDALELLVYGEILIRLNSGNQIVYRFNHSLIQDVAYQGLLKRSRRQLHATIARVFEEKYPQLVESEPGFIAEHFRAAERFRDAIKYLLMAATAAMTKFANREAIEHADQGIVLIRKLEDQEEKEQLELEFQMVKAMASRALYGFAKKSTTQAFQRIMELATKQGSARHYSRAIRGLFNSLQAEGHYDEAVAMADRMIESSTDDNHGRMTGHHMRAIPLIWQGKFLAAKQELKLSAKYFWQYKGSSNQTDDEYPPHIQSTLAINLAFMGEYQNAHYMASNALQNAKSKSNPLETANRYLNACNALRIIRHPDSLVLATEFQTFVSEHEIPYYSAAVSAFVGLAMFEQGETEGGLELLKEGWHLFTQTQSRLNQVFYMAELAECNLIVGNIKEAKNAVENGFELMNQYGERNFEAELHRINGNIMTTNDKIDITQIHEEYQAAIRIAHQQSARIFELKAQIALSNSEQKFQKTIPISAGDSTCEMHHICTQFQDIYPIPDLQAVQRNCKSGSCPLGND